MIFSRFFRQILLGIHLISQELLNSRLYTEKNLKKYPDFFPSNRKVLNEIKIEIFVKFQKLDFSVNFENWNFLHQF